MNVHLVVLAAAVGLMLAGCGGEDRDPRPARAPGATHDSCARVMRSLRVQARDPKASPADRKAARQMLRLLGAQQAGQPTGEFNSGCATISIPVTRTSP